MQITHATLQSGVRSETVRELARRIEAEYVEMPSLSVTLPQRADSKDVSRNIDGPRLFVDATAAWPFAAITHAASRLSETIRPVRKRNAMNRSRL